MKPGFYFNDVVSGDRVSGRSDGFGGKLELNVISKVHKGRLCDKVEHVHDEKEGTETWGIPWERGALGDLQLFMLIN